jgi:hypothetical protein
MRAPGGRCRRARVVLAASVLSLVVSGAPGPRAEGPSGAAAPQPDFTPEAAEAVARGHEWLARHQNKNGSFGASQVPVATTSLAGLSFLAGGSVPGRGRYAESVKSAVKYLLECQSYNKRGYIAEPSRGGSSRMHGHGYATLFLAEVLGMTSGIADDLDVEVIRESVKKAVRLIEESQSRDGGWTYEPSPQGDEGSVTVTQVQALRSARSAGIRVNKTTIDRAVDYIRKSSNADGGVRYSLSSGGSDSTFALTAAGVSVMNYLGEYEMPQIERGLKYLDAGMKGPGVGRRPRGQFQGYEDFYATLAFYQAGGDYWARQWPKLRSEMIKRRAADGSWSDSYGNEFGTAFSTLTLQIPNQYLPIFQR